MIIWLASYPKSGNTWLRAFISSLLYSDNGKMNKDLWQKINQFPLKDNFKDLINNEEIFLLKEKNDVYELFKEMINAQYKINLDKKIKFLKTHFLNCTINNYSFTDYNNTLGTIHILRDPRNVISSLLNHYNLENLESACKFMFNEENWIVDEPNLPYAPLLLSSWGTHYNLWKQSQKNYLLIKYENLINYPIEEFTKIKEYIENIMKIKINDEIFNNALRSTSFENLKEMETKNQFTENSINKKTNKKNVFFRLGKNNQWKKTLKKEIKNQIENRFYKEMKELGYL